MDKEQQALADYIKISGRVGGIDSAGKIHYDIPDQIISLAVSEVNNNGYMLAVDENGKRTPESEAMLQEAIESILYEINLTTEERFVSREKRCRLNTKTSFENYEHFLKKIMDNYATYVSCCNKLGVEPKEMYPAIDSQSKTR